MNIIKIIEYFEQNNAIDNSIVSAIQNDESLRKSIVDYFRTNSHHRFALALLDKIMLLRENEEILVGSEDIMIACYIVGLHKQIEDSLIIWNTKLTDFDTFCMIDSELVVFAGVKETTTYLESKDSADAEKALEHIRDCNEAGDFDDLDEYFSEKPWYV